MKLTPSDRRAIEHAGRNLQLMACAGSSKTEVVRFAVLVAQALRYPEQAVGVCIGWLPWLHPVSLMPGRGRAVCITGLIAEIRAAGLL